MADNQPTLILTQNIDGDWTVSIVANPDQGAKRAANMAADATVKQSVAVPIILAALAPRMKDLLAGHADIDAMMEQVEIGEEVVSMPSECQQCGVPHAPEGLVKCSSCMQYICPACNSDKGQDCELCQDCYDSLQTSETELAADLKAEGKTEA